MNPSPSRKQLTIFDAPIIDTNQPLYLGDPRYRPIPWEEALDRLIALGKALNSKKRPTP
jgi:anaerobic selenocysteine-containing dehydrogenase